MSWRVAKSLKALQGQLDRAYPGRSKASDGFRGDAAHASRASDHNAWVKDGNTGVVTAGDYTHDPANGADMNLWATAIIESRDPRIKYVIWRRQIWRAYSKPGLPAWTPQAYGGANPHTKHAHVSVQPDKRLYDDESAWAMPTGAEEDAMTPEQEARVKEFIQETVNKAFEARDPLLTKAAASGGDGATAEEMADLLARRLAE